MKCKNCGKPCGNYELCKACYYEEQDKLLSTVDSDILFNVNDDDLDDDNDSSANEKENDCLTCDEDARGYLFCRNCYYKYKDETIYLKVENCTHFELLKTKEKQPTYVCEDGHIVKSKSERAIDDYLFKNEIWHIYEKPYNYSKNKTFKPDFYLPKLNIYIEHWGLSEKPEYLKTKEFKMKIYLRDKATVICTNEEEMKGNISALLKGKLKYYEKGKINQ